MAEWHLQRWQTEPQGQAHLGRVRQRKIFRTNLAQRARVLFCGTTLVSWSVVFGHGVLLGLNAQSATVYNVIIRFKPDMA